MLAWRNTAAGAVVLATTAPCLAYDVSDTLSLGVTTTAVYQYGDFDDAEISDTGRAALVADVEGNFRPTDRDEFSVVVSLAEGNALNQVSPLSLAPYADDLEDDVKDINGRGRDYLLTAWYKHTFALSETSSLGLTGGPHRLNGILGR